MKRFAQTLIASSALFFSQLAYSADDYVILEMGEREIKKSEVDMIWQGLFPPGAVPEFDKIEEPIRQNVLRGVISEYLLYDEALAANVDNNDQVKRQIEDAKRKLIVRHYIDQKTEGMIAESDLKKAYDEMVAKQKDKEEVRARHILVESEDKAKELKKQIDGGSDFEKLATENSKDPGSKTQGGDLGYFTQEKMVPEFSAAAFALKEGEISGPVKSSFGWHIIKVEDRRPVEAPKYEEVKAELKKNLVEERLNDYVNKLVDKTNVTYYGPDGQKRDLTKMPDAAKDDKRADASQ